MDARVEAVVAAARKWVAIYDMVTPWDGPIFEWHRLHKEAEVELFRAVRELPNG